MKKFGVREICDIVFRAKSDIKLGGLTFKQGDPVLYIDSAKTSSVEGAATTVYAQGGRGNARLITWEGEKTVTFTFEDALLSPVSFAMLSGAGLLDVSTDAAVHMTMQTTVSTGPTTISVSFDGIDEDSDLYAEIDTSVEKLRAIKMKDDQFAAAPVALTKGTGGAFEGTSLAFTAGDIVFLDFYVKKTKAVKELQIDANKFAGTYYIEASTLFRDTDGIDYPANFTLPTAKIQSNFTFTMASTGDPSTFTFTIDAMPGYTYFNKTKKVICAIQVIEDPTAANEDDTSVLSF